MHISFVILHYITIDDTFECIESIIGNIDYEDYSIIVVDNGSPNNTANILLEKYSNVSNVKILISKKNLGFAKGNNIGFNYAKYEMKADFIILINNDTIIKQKEFCSLIIDNFNKNNFHIGGPNIISLVDNNQQNPVEKIFYSYEQVQKMKIKFQLLLVFNLIRCDKFLEKLLEYKNSKRKIKKDNNEFQLHGSCLIFSPKYIKKYDGLYDKTFMYLEECILKYISDKEGLEMIYCKNITIYHKEDSSTNASMKCGYKKRKFYYENSIDSCNILLSLMKEN